MKVIGAIGLNGAGKDELVDYLHRRCSIPVLTVGDVPREIAEEEGIEPTRENLHEVSERYMAHYGEDYFTRRIIKRIEESGWTAVGISGIRTPTDVQALRDRFGPELLLVYVEVTDPYTRYKRTKRRGKARDPDAYEEFKRQEKAEEEMFRMSETIEEADVTINNDDSLEAFHQRIEATIVRQALSGCRGTRLEE
jgi:dephospho-CoA kinase